jgi:hypothetical protein
VSFPGPGLFEALREAPTGAAFDIVLILHVGSMLVGLTSMFATGVEAWRARRGPDAPGAQSVARYFRPGINWPGRALWLVLILGIALVAMSRGVYSLSDTFVQVGLVLWIVAMSLAELVVWPGERMLQGIISGSPAARGSTAGRESTSAPDSPADSSRSVGTGKARSIAVRVAFSAWAVCAVLIVATVVMFQKP